MRLRNNPRAMEIIQQHKDIVIFRPQDFKGKWHQYLNEHGENSANSPIHVELGMGRGKFITTNGLLHRDINFIGIDLRAEVILSALQKVLDNELSNVLFLPLNIANIQDAFDIGEVDTLYINFCDPWPKVRHSKRRLTHKLFLEKYKSILSNNGEIIFKTDSRDLFEFSLSEFSDMGFDIVDKTFDLNNGDYPDNITTEYEEKFMKMGIKINRLKAVKK
ncbi:MAG: tRNA (guanosine(46)-N7)-methyltransferase TrmB [Caulobacteraceae bacterium]